MRWPLEAEMWSGGPSGPPASPGPDRLRPTLAPLVAAPVRHSRAAARLATAEAPGLRPGLCLLVVLVTAKLLVLRGQAVEPTLWALPAYFSQDVAIAIAVGVIDVLLRRPRFGWVLYALAVAYVAINVPITRVLGSPLTMSMLRAARGPLVDSIVLYLTAPHITSVLLVLALGAGLPIVSHRRALGTRHSALERSGHVRIATAIALAIGLAVVALGPSAVARVETRGLDRNAFTALAPLNLPVATASASARDWRESPFPSPGTIDLARYRGSAKGLNVLVIALESTAARYLRPYGAAEDPMPALTALGNRALLFENMYAAYPESIKGLFATLCSRYPAFSESPETHAAAPCASLAETLSGAGYRTALFHSGRFAYLGMEALIRNKGFQLLEDAGAIGGNVHSSFGVDEPATVARMLGWIDALPPDQRFFITYLPVAGHHPYASPVAGPFPTDTDLGRYRNALHYGDRSLAVLLAGLRSRHLDGRTVVVVYGDHGEAFGQHPGNMGHTLFIDDENVKVPYLIAIPGVTDQGVRVPAVGSLIDTAPTLLEVLGLPAERAHQGTSLLRPGTRMALFFTDYALGWLGLRDGCWKYVFEINAARSKLFDVCRDPDETRDVSASAPDRVRAYGDRVRQWSAVQKALMAGVVRKSP